jgi:hypothetical protein
MLGKAMEKSEELPHEVGPNGQRLCGAYARTTGKPCRDWAMKNGRCRRHGGKSTGARNPYQPITHGRYTQEAIAERKEARELMKKVKNYLPDT